MNIIKSKFLKLKKDGMIDDFLPLMAFVLIVAIILFTFIETNTAINSKADINAISRKYTLLLETQGHLTSNDQKNLVNDLNDAGFRANEAGALLTTSSIRNKDNFNENANTAQISYSGDSNNSVGYGQPVALQIKVFTDVKMLSEANIFDPTIETGYYDESGNYVKKYSPIVVKYHSTSKE